MLHAEELQRSQYLMGTKDVVEVDEDETALPDILQRLKQPCQIDRTVCTHLENDWSNPHCYCFFIFVRVRSTWRLLES